MLEVEKKNNSSNVMLYFIFTWHNVFLALTMSMIDFNTILPTLINILTDSKIVLGALYSILLAAPLLFNFVFSYYMSSFKYRRRFLITGIYLRSISFFLMAVVVYFFAVKSPSITLGSLFFLIFLFSTSGGMAGLAYADLISKIVPKNMRAKLYSIKQFAGSAASFLGAVLVSKIFSTEGFSFPVNYSLSFFIGFLGLMIASITFWLIKEPASKVNDNEKSSLGFLIKSIPKILKDDPNFFKFILVENFSSFSLMVLPFYIIFAQEFLYTDSSYIGKFLFFQIIGTISSNVMWGVLGSHFGVKNVVSICIFIGGIIPLIAILLSNFPPMYFSIVFILIGFVISGRRIGFEPYLLEISPPEQTILYLGIRGTLNLFTVLLPLLGGFFIQFFGYIFTFVLVSIMMFISFFLLKRKGNKKPT